MKDKRPDSEFALDLIKMESHTHDLPGSGRSYGTAARPYFEMTASQFEGTETVVLAAGSAGVPRTEDLRRLSKQIRSSKYWEGDGRKER